MGGEEMDFRFKISDLRLGQGGGGDFEIFDSPFTIRDFRSFDGSTKLTRGKVRAGPFDGFD
jgi:hypothetical protein